MLLKIELVKDYIQTFINQTTNTVQNIHGSVADAAYRIASQHEPIAGKLDEIKKHHDHASDAVYDAIRNINQAFGEIISDYIEAMEDGLHANKVISANKKAQSQKEG